MTRPCSVDGCPRPHFGKGLCNTHYYRLRRTGTTDPRPKAPPRARTKEPRIVARPPKRLCSVDDCKILEDGRAGLCKKHDTRRRRHGDPLTYIDPASRNFPTGEDHPHWSGEAANYFTIHQRLKKRRGPASRYNCACGKRALQWAYDHADPDQRFEMLGNTRAAFSLDLAHYDPMCASCHKLFDLRRLRAEK